MEKIILILITSIPIIYQISELQGLELTNIQHAPILFLNVVLIFYFLKNKAKLKKKALIILAILLTAIFVIPVVMYKITETTFSENLKYTAFYLNFIVSIALTGTYMSSNYKKVLGSFLIGNTVVLFTSIIKNKDEIYLQKCIDNIIYLFKLLDKKHTIYLGFNYPNIVSLFIIIEIFLLYKFKQTFVNRNIYINIFFDLCICLLVIPLLATGSRTAIIGIITFCAFNAFFSFYIKLKSNMKVIISAGMSVACILFGYINFDKIIFAESMRIRLEDVKRLINYLIQNNKIITGVGPVENTLSYAETTGLKNTLDNGYIAFGAQYGIIGLVLILSVVGYALYISFREKNNQSCALILTFLIYACVENVLFIPRVLMSLLVWVFIVNSSMYDQSKNDNMKCDDMNVG